MEQTARVPKTVADCFSIDDLRELARRRLPRCIFDFYDGGAEEERTLAGNRRAFSQHRFIPRILRDVSNVDTASTLFGARLSAPIGIAPMGGLGFGWRDADLHVARAARQYGIPFTLSSSATASIEDVARQAGGRLWFQAYVLRDEAFFWKLLARAAHSGYEALVITVDLPVGGKRERDARNHFSIPFRITPRNLLDFAARPGWTLDLLGRGIPAFENLRGLEPGAGSAMRIASSVGRSYDPSFDWTRLHKVRETWRGKLVVKGVSHPDDAARLVAMGCDALVVSNHGGRQLDNAIPSLLALAAVAQAVAGRVPVLLDGGIRRGSDVAVALALGACAVLVGRATLFGVAAGGAAGAQRALGILFDEFKRTLQLCGAASPTQLGPGLLDHGPLAAPAQ